MARVEFTDDYDYSPTEGPRSLIAYKRGYIGTVRRECCDRAVAAGKAIELPTLTQEAAADEEALPEPSRRRTRKPQSDG